MLARKYYAQKGNSRGRMNTLSLSGTNSSRLNYLKKQQIDPTVFKRVPNIPQSQYIKEKMLKEIQCTDISFAGGNPSCPNTDKKICNVTKDLDTPTQGEYIERFYSRNCILRDELQKPFVQNILSGEGC